MNIRVHRTIALPFGLRLNLGKTGASMSWRLGGIGTLNLSRRGLRWSGRTPIRGVTYSKQLYPRRPTPPKHDDTGPIIDADFTVVPKG